MQINDPTSRWIYLPGMRSNIDLNELRLPFLKYIPNKARNHLVAAIGEFVGTFLFLFFSFAATQVANTAHNGAQDSEHSIADIPDTGTLMYIALAFGFSLAVNAWVFFRISGGLFNPAVTLGLVLIGSLKWVRAGLVFVAQILGATAASAVVYILFPGTLQVATTLGGKTSVVQGLFIEALLTAELVFTIFMLAAEKHKGTFLAPIGIGLSLFVAELTGVYFTGGSLNPARSFGPCVVLHDFPGYHWIYWAGPAIGSIIAATFYHLVKVLEYETANPGQDFNEKEIERFVFDEENAHTGAHVVRPDALSPVISPSGDDYRGRSPPSSLPSMSPHNILAELANGGRSPAADAARRDRDAGASPPRTPEQGPSGRR